MTALWIGWAALGLAGWWALLRRNGLPQRVEVAQWRGADVVICSLFALLIVAGIFADKGEVRAITLADLQGGAFVYFALTLFVLGVAVSRSGFSGGVFGLCPARPMWVAGLGLAGIFLTFPLVQMMQELVALIGSAPGDGDEMVQFLLGKTTPAERAWAVGLAVGLAPLTEELVFRGYVYGVFKKYGGRVAAMLTSAALFAAMHNNVPAIPALMTLAIGLTVIYELTGSLWAPIVMHMVFNLAPVVVILGFPEWIPKP